MGLDQTADEPGYFKAWFLICRTSFVPLMLGQSDGGTERRDLLLQLQNLRPISLQLALISTGLRGPWQLGIVARSA